MAHMPEINEAIQGLPNGRFFWIDWAGSGNDISLRCRAVNGYRVLVVGGKILEDLGWYQSDDYYEWEAGTKFIPVSDEEQAGLEALLKLKPDRLWIGPGGKKMEYEDA